MEIVLHSLNIRVIESDCDYLFHHTLQVATVSVAEANTEARGRYQLVFGAL